MAKKKVAAPARKPRPTDPVAQSRLESPAQAFARRQSVVPLSARPAIYYSVAEMLQQRAAKHRLYADRKLAAANLKLAEALMATTRVVPLEPDRPGASKRGKLSEAALDEHIQRHPLKLKADGTLLYSVGARLKALGSPITRTALQKRLAVRRGKHPPSS